MTSSSSSLRDLLKSFCDHCYNLDPELSQKKASSLLWKELKLIYQRAKKEGISPDDLMIYIGTEHLELEDGFQVVSFLISMTNLSEAQRLFIIKSLLDFEPNIDIHKPNPFYATNALHDASLNGYVDILRLLVAKGGNIHLEDDHRWNALHWAIHGSDLNMVQELVACGADPLLHEDETLPELTSLQPLVFASSRDPAVFEYLRDLTTALREQKMLSKLPSQIDPSQKNLETPKVRKNL